MRAVSGSARPGPVGTAEQHPSPLLSLIPPVVPFSRQHPTSPGSQEDLDRARVIDAIYRSAELGREISLVEEEEALAAD